MSKIRKPPTDRRLAKFHTGARSARAAQRAPTNPVFRAFALAFALLAVAAAAPPARATAAHPEAAHSEFERGLRLYEAGHYESAVAAFEKAATVHPEDDRYAYWLGKSCGRVAERAGPLSALKWAGRTRDALERAVELNPENREAVSSLADYYEQAPGFLGGDRGKARELRARLASLPPDPAAASPY